MLLIITNTSPEPMHAQISRQIRARILAGTLRENDMLPSIRILAGDLKVSVITVQRAYDDLMHEGLIHSRHGKGYFVNPLTTERKKELSLERFIENIQPVIKDGLAGGLNPNEIKQVIKKTLRDED